MSEQPVWEEFLERMEETFKEYLDNFSINQDKLAEQFKDILMDIDFDKIFKEYLENLDIGYVIQNFLERFNLEDYYVKESTTLYGGKSYSLKKSMKEDKKIDLDKAFKIITDLELWNEDNMVELRTHEVFSIIQASTMKLRKALGDE